MPYRSTTRRPVAAVIRSWSCTGSAAEPDTSSRAPPSALARSVSSTSASASRWYIVGTPNSIVAPAPSSRATPCALNLPRCRTAAPRRSGPRMPRIARHMEERQPVHEHVVAGPLPGVGQRVQGRGDGAPRNDGTLRRAGGAGSVHDEGGGGVVRFGVGACGSGATGGCPDRRLPPGRRRAPSRSRVTEVRRRARRSPGTARCRPECAQFASPTWG